MIVSTEHFYNFFVFLPAIFLSGSWGDCWCLSQLYVGKGRVQPWVSCQFIAQPYHNTFQVFDALGLQPRTCWVLQMAKPAQCTRWSVLWMFAHVHALFTHAFTDMYQRRKRRRKRWRKRKRWRRKRMQTAFHCRVILLS